MMMYYIIRAVEVLVMVFVGFCLITQSYEMRWNSIGVKAILFCGLIFWVILLFANSFWSKFSAIEYLLMLIYFAILAAIFYRIPLLHVGVHSMLYCVNLLLVHLVIFFICSNLERQSLEQYISNTNSWNGFQILGMSLVIISVLFLYLKRKGRKLLRLSRNRYYIYLFALLGLELAFIELVVSETAVSSNDWKDTLIIILFMIVVVEIGIAFIIYHTHISERNQMLFLKLKYSNIDEQFKYLQESYEAKSRQIHDSTQQTMLLKGYLKAGKMDEAYRYLDEIQNKTVRMKRGVSDTSIDFILNCKTDEAMKYGIEIRTDLDIYFCPLGKNDLCILLGNLLDNAMEAVKDLPKGNRFIILKMQSVNNMFLLEISNVYIGKRKRCGGKYETTKTGSGIHGLGLESCKNIVKQYDGLFEIEDDGEIFKVEVTIYKDENGG